jgi:hypothetical protein
MVAGICKVLLAASGSARRQCRIVNDRIVDR